MPLPRPAAASTSRGLASAEAARRLAECGPNEIHRAAPTPAWRILARQFASPLIALLAAAAGLAGALGEVADAVAIATIVALNGVVGFVQEHRAERAILALRGMTAPRAHVLRDGHVTVVPAAVVVPGDVLVLEAGEIVAADARLVEAHALRTAEAALTGESAPVEKSTRPAPADAPLAERTDRVYAGTHVSAGSGLAVVEATGMRTELGKVASLLAETTKEETPLQRQLAGVSRTLIAACLVVVAVVAALGAARGQPSLEIVLGAVSLAVAAVPEGLPAVVTIALAVGVQRMAARNVLVRRLSSVETLGAASVICTDKTGTLTTGRMVVREVWGQDRRATLTAAAACCDADLDGDAGDPTELALLAAARQLGVEHAELEAANPRRHVNPFDADRKRMSIERADGVLYVKGAPELVAERCVEGLAGAQRAAEDMAARGLRVLAIATGAGREEAGLTLLGLVGIADPPRSEATDAVASARRAGIRTVMITGDHPDTALAIAREMAIVRAGEPAGTSVHARATPSDKLRIVRDWKARGAVVAMTGDGVNDAPALREAHIGIAMGIAGTEVTREAADMVLADDNFASIVAALREGRAIYANVRKTLAYLLTGNVAELAIMLSASIAGLPAPLLPIQLLWVNLVTDGLPALALVMDPPGPDVLDAPPRRPTEPMLGRRQWPPILAAAAVEAVVVVAVYAVSMDRWGVEVARTLGFSTLVYSELFRAFAARSARQTLWGVGVLSNLTLIGVVGLSACLQLALVYLPFTADLFGVVAVPPARFAIAVAAGLVPVTLLELAKLLRRPAAPPPDAAR